MKFFCIVVVAALMAVVNAQLPVMQQQQPILRTGQPFGFAAQQPLMQQQPFMQHQPMIGGAFGQQPIFQQQPIGQFGAQPFLQQQQPILGGTYGGVLGQQLQQPLQLGGFGGLQQQPAIGSFGVAQPIGGNWAGIPQLGFGGVGMQQQPAIGSFGAAPTNIGAYAPALAGVGAVASQTPILTSNMMGTGLGSVGMGAVLPQNFGNPAAAYGQLQQPVLSPQQALQVVPIDQLQQALNQRVSNLGQYGAMQPAAGIQQPQQQPMMQPQM